MRGIDRATRLTWQSCHGLKLSGTRRRFISTATLHPSAESAAEWDAVLANTKLKQDIKRALIFTHPAPYWESGAFGSNSLPEELEGWKAPSEFFSAMQRLRDFPNLDAVEIRFTNEVMTDNLYDTVAENQYQRSKILTALFEAASGHNAEAGNSVIRSLSIKNLQDDIQHGLVGTEAFRSTMKELTGLHLQIANEYDPHSPENSIMFEDFRSFWPYLRELWLEPIAARLSSLTLYCTEYWGFIPKFDVEGLDFPRLESLALGGYTFATDAQLEWLMRQRSLRSLTLDSCPILHHIETEEDTNGTFGVDAKMFRDALPGLEVKELKMWDGLQVLAYDRNWSHYFDETRDRLCNLTKFQIGYGPWQGVSGNCWPANMAFEQRESLGAKLVPSRYIAFNSGIGPSQWMSPRDGDSYGPGASVAADQTPAVVHGRIEQAALEELLEVVRKRSNV